MSTGDTGADPESLVRRWFGDLFTEGALGVADDILAAAVDYRGPPSLSPTDVAGPADIKAFVQVYQTAFPDLRYTVESITEDDGTCFVRWSAVGTQEGDLFGLEASGESFAVEGISVFETEDGQITTIHAQWDTLKMVQELGGVPTETMPSV